MTYVSELNLVYQLTWQSPDVYVWAVSETVESNGEVRHSISPSGILRIPDTSQITDKWQGLAHWSGGENPANNALIASDGSNQLFIMGASNMTILMTLDVADFWGRPIEGLKELELINHHPDEEIRGPLSGYVFANEAGTDYLHMIDLSIGLTVRQWYLAELREAVEDHFRDSGREDLFDWDDHYLNGIAYDKSRDTFLLTGIEWGIIFEVTLDYKRILGLGDY